MRPLAWILRTCFFLLALLMSAAIVPVAAYAQKDKDKEPEAPATKTWIAGYGIALLGIVLGLAIVLRPGTRGDETK